MKGNDIVIGQRYVLTDGRYRGPAKVLDFVSRKNSRGVMRRLAVRVELHDGEIAEKALQAIDRPWTDEDATAFAKSQEATKRRLAEKAEEDRLREAERQEELREMERWSRFRDYYESKRWFAAIPDPREQRRILQLLYRDEEGQILDPSRQANVEVTRDSRGHHKLRVSNSGGFGRKEAEEVFDLSWQEMSDIAETLLRARFARELGKAHEDRPAMIDVDEIIDNAMALIHNSAVWNWSYASHGDASRRRKPTWEDPYSRDDDGPSAA
jgi:hypothetical protein